MHWYLIPPDLLTISNIQNSRTTLLPYVTHNIPQHKDQHGFKPIHSTTTALHQITNQITQGFNQKRPPQRTIVVALDPSKALDTVNIYTLINKLHQTTVPNTIVKFIANYIKGRKGFTIYQVSKSKKQQFKLECPREEYYLPYFSICTPLMCQIPL